MVEVDRFVTGHVTADFDVFCSMSYWFSNSRIHVVLQCQNEIFSQYLVRTRD